MLHFRLLLPVLAALSLSTLVHAATITVNSVEDTAIANDGKVTLREAIAEINAGGTIVDTDMAGAGVPDPYGTNDTIKFNIPGSGLQTITLASALPNIVKPVFINGYSQPGASPNTNSLDAGINTVLRIELDLNQTGGAPTLQIAASAPGTVIRGLAINHASTILYVNAQDVVIAGNFIGTDATGTTRKYFGSGGIGIQRALGGHITIGGPAPADRNLISGGSNNIYYITESGAANDLIQGNYIGTDVSGTHALGVGGSYGLYAVAEALVQDNLISGNGFAGAHVFDHTTFITNLIGTQRDGTSALPNGAGILIQGSGSIIGNEGNGNTIAFNNLDGVAVQQSTGHPANSNRIQWNSIYANRGKGINLAAFNYPLDNDPTGGPRDAFGNRGQNYPVISVVSAGPGKVTVSGTLRSLPSTQFFVNLYANAACDAPVNGVPGHGGGQTSLGSYPVSTDASGNGIFPPTVVGFPPGQSIITATARDSANNSSEFSQCASAASAPAATTTTLTSSLNPSLYGQSVTFTASVGGGAAPTGKMQFMDGASALGAPVALSGATAMLTIATLNVGGHPITAAYSGDTNNSASTSPVLNQVVNAAPRTPTTTTLTSSLNPAPVGQSVTFSAVVAGVQIDSVRRGAPDASAQAAPAALTGTVTFSDGAAVLVSVALGAGGSAAFATSSLTVGNHPITATYSGDATNAGSSGSVNQVITALPPAVPSVPAPMLGAWAAVLMILLLAAVACARAKSGRRSSR